MEKSKRIPTPIPVRKIKERSAPIEFVAPYSLEECKLRLCNTKHYPVLKFWGSSFAPSLIDYENGVIHFWIRRKSVYSGKHEYTQTAAVELDGYLRGIDEQSTSISATIHMEWWRIIQSMVLMLLVGLLFDWIAHQRPIFIYKWFASIYLYFIGVLYILSPLPLFFQRRALQKVLYTAMSEAGAVAIPPAAGGETPSREIAPPSAVVYRRRDC